MKNKISVVVNKVGAVISFVLCGLCILVGIISFAVGGFLFIIFGAIFFLLGRSCRKRIKKLTDETVPQDPQSIVKHTPYPTEKPTESQPTTTPIIDTPQVTTPPPASTPKPEAPTPTESIKIKTYKVTGMSHYIDNIMNLSSENIYYDLSKKQLIEEGYDNERVYQYDFYPKKTELVPEPDNPYDSNAVKVVVDGEHVGYIKSGSCSHILKLLKEDRIKKIDCTIAGGKYKYVGYDEDEDTYYMDKDEAPFFVHLSISEI